MAETEHDRLEDRVQRLEATMDTWVALMRGCITAYEINRPEPIPLFDQDQIASSEEGSEKGN